MITHQMEEYLEAVGKLQERGEPASVSTLARELNVAPPTVTEMLHRLAEQGYLRYEARRPVELTAQGAEAAGTVIRRHRLWERFLRDVLGLRWDLVHDQACQLEHVTSPELERRIAQAAGDPLTCPHGYSIPAGDTLAPERAALPLNTLSAGYGGHIARVGEQPALLRRLESAGIAPGAEIRVQGISAAGRYSVLIGECAHELSDEDAGQVWVSPEAPEAVGDILPLTDLAAGEQGLVHGFRAGRSLMARCLALGFTPGAPLRIIQNLRGGPLIALVRETRVALGYGEAQRILVQRTASTPAAAHA